MTEGPFDEIRRVQVPRPSPRLLTGAVILLLGGIFVMTSFFQVGPEETGIVLRFGKFVRSSDPGLHLRLPMGIERVIKVAVQRQHKEEFGFRTTRADIRSQFATVGDESNMLTGDLNAGVVEWVVQFRIIEPYNYLFRVRHVKDTLRDLSEAVARTVVGDRTVNEVLTIGRQDVADLIETRLQELCDQYETGIKIEQVVLQDVNPPEEVKSSFNEVNQAQQDRERLINEAQSEYNKVIPRAEGEAQQTIQQAEGYALDRVNRAQGEAERFNRLYAAYARSPEITRKRIYLETMETILPTVKNKIVVDSDLRSILPLLNLNPNQGGGE